MFFSERSILEECFRELLDYSAGALPVGRAEIRTERLSALEVEDAVYDVREEPHYVWVVLDLSEAAFDIIGCNDNISGWVSDSEVPDPRE